MTIPSGTSYKRRFHAARDLDERDPPAARPSLSKPREHTRSLEPLVLCVVDFAENCEINTPGTSRIKQEAQTTGWSSIPNSEERTSA